MASGAERVGVVRQVDRREALQQRARQRPLHVDLRRPAGDVGDEHVPFADVAPHPPLDVPVRGVGGHHEEVVVGDLGDGEVGLQQAACVEPLGVGDAADVAVHRVGRQLVEQRTGVAALHAEGGHEAHVGERHRVAGGLVLGAPLLPEARPAPGERARVGGEARSGEPVGALPAAHIAERRALRGQRLVQRRALHAAGGLHRPVRVVALVHHPQRLDGTGAAVLGGGLVRLGAGDVEAGDVDLRVAAHDPLGHHPAEAATGEDADRVQPGGHEVVGDLGRLAHDGGEVGGEALRAAEERADAGLGADGHPAHGPLDVRAHPVPVGLQRCERHVVGDGAHVPRRAHRLEQADHQPAHLFAVVAVVGGVFDDGPRRVEAVDVLGDEVVVLGRLQWDGHPVALAQLAGPHASAVHHHVALDGAVVGGHTGHPAGGAGAGGDHLGDGDALHDGGALLAGTLGQRHGHVDGVHPPVAGYVEAGQQVVGAGQREEVRHLLRGDLLHLHAHVAVERGDAAVLLEAIGCGGQLDEAHRLEPGGLAGLGLETAVQVACVATHRRAGLAGAAEGDHQPGGVPGGARGELVALHQHHVVPAEMGQVVGDRRADDTAADDHHSGAGGEVVIGRAHGGERSDAARSRP